MKSLSGCFLCLLLLGLVLQGAASRAPQHSMETRSECWTLAASLFAPPPPDPGVLSTWVGLATSHATCSSSGGPPPARTSRGTNLFPGEPVPS